MASNKSWAKKGTTDAAPVVSNPTMDSYTNFAAKLGIGGDNMASAGQYSFNPITRNRFQLELAYRGSWIVAAAVDHAAEDMTRAGVEILSSLQPDQMEGINAAINDLMIWQELCNTIRWARLYGGCLGLLMIDGDDVSQPLNMDAIRPGSFKGILPLDRWRLTPSQDLVQDLGPSLGKPNMYKAMVDQLQSGIDIHHSRCIRLTGLELPYYQAVSEQMWGLSVVERLWDRLLNYDSTTAGTAQLVYKAHLRTMKVEKLRDLLAAGGKMVDVMVQHVNMIRQFQSTEGLTLIDSADDFETHQYTFAGLDKVLLEFGDQLCAAIEEPRARLFGQSPGGIGSTGEGELRTYHESIGKKQESQLRRPVTVILDVLVRSVTGAPPPPGFSFKFRPLWQMTEEQKATIAKDEGGVVIEAFGAGIIGRKTALQELRASSADTGVFSNISDEEIDEADEDPPAPADVAPGDDAEEEGDKLKGGKAKPTKDGFGGWLGGLFNRQDRAANYPLITTQAFLDPAIRDEKRRARDYSVQVTPPFTWRGRTVCAVLDGHHSLAAARLDGVKPVCIPQNGTQFPAVQLIEAGRVDEFLDTGNDNGADWFEA